MSKDKIEFDKSKVLTAVTADQAKVGDVGWFADNLEDLRNHVASGKPAPIKGIMDESESYRFLKYNSKWTLFYPAPYSYRQERWVQENDLKAGDKVKVIKKWKLDECGYGYSCHNSNSIGDVATVEGVYEESIRVRFEGDSRDYPYFAIEKVKEEPKGEYRPFANAEEFAPYRDRWFIDKHDSDIVRVELYCNSGITEVRGYCSYDELLNSYTFDDGTPAGVKL